MRGFSAFGLGLLTAVLTFPASALTITNGDQEATTVTVIVNGEGSEQAIEPGASVEPACDNGCTVELDSGEQYQMQGKETATIDGGVLFIDSAPDIPEEDYPDVDVPDPDQPMESDAPAEE